MELTNEMCERFLKIRKEHPAKPSREEFGEMLGMSGEMVRNLELPGRMKQVRDDVVNNVCNVFGVNKEWLLTGEGEMYRTGIIPELTHVLRHNPALEAMLGAMLDKMGPEDWDALNRIVEKAMKKEQP